MIFFMFIDQEGLSQKTPRKLFYDAPLLTLYLFRAAHLRVIRSDPNRSEPNRKLKLNMVTKLKLNMVAKLKLNMVTKLKLNMVEKLKLNMAAKLKLNMVAKLKLNMVTIKIRHK